jgi:hypothetical protein
MAFVIFAGGNGACTAMQIPLSPDSQPLFSLRGHFLIFNIRFTSLISVSGRVSERMKAVYYKKNATFVVIELLKHKENYESICICDPQTGSVIIRRSRVVSAKGIGSAR